MLGGLLSMYAETIHDWATDKGFWPELPPEVEVQRKLSKLALMVEEIGELVSAVRAKEMPEAEHIAGFTQEEEEAADLLTRLLDYCSHYKVRVGQAMVTKMAYNHTRPHLHGKQA
jgi:NTP pyrophosphatase (non-canonical NTP hydrolase)